MAFTLGKKEEKGKVVVKDGPQAQSKKKPVSNKIGVNVSLDTNTGTLNGKINFFEVKTELNSRSGLEEAIEKAINDYFKPQL